ncbi:MAG: hypothetical protein V3U36_04400 [Anaerolineales bacterium]
MKVSILGLVVLIMSVQWSSAQQKDVNPSTMSSTSVEQEIINLPKDKWRWMSERKVDSLAALFQAQHLLRGVEAAEGVLS